MPILFTIVIIAAVAFLVWYIMAKRNQGTISIYPESREAVPGDTITGDIHIKSNKEIDCEKIQLSVRVNEIWMQEEHDWDNDSSGSLVINGTRVLGSDNRVQTGNSKPVYHEVIELAGQTHLDSGKTSYTFDALLPTEDELVAKSHVRCGYGMSPACTNPRNSLYPSA